MASEFVRLAKVEATWINHRIFNVRCQKSDIIPQSLVVKPPDNTTISAGIAKSTSRRFLKQRIYLCNRRLDEIRNHVNRLSESLTTILPSEMLRSLTDKAEYVKATEGRKIRDRHIRKFNQLCYKHNRTGTHHRYNSSSQRIQCKNVVNVSSKALSEFDLALLEKGLNFTVSKSNLTAEEVIPSVEPALRDMSAPDAENVRSQIVGILKTQIKGDSNLTKEEQHSLRKLRNDKEIVITKADKGNTTVVMDKVDYLRKTKEHITTGPYKEVTVKNGEQIMKKEKENVANYLRVVKENLGKEKWYSLYPKATRMPRFYGQPKVHKPSMPIRPIVDGIDSPTHELARELARILKPLTGQTRTYVKNSLDFVEKIKTTTIENDDVMVSFDVVSLYTNVPKNRAIERATELLIADEALKNRTNLTVEQIVEGIAICLNANHFLHASTIYTQEQGLAMGSPISPVLANIYMELLENRILDNFPYPPKIWWRYVDDTFVVINRNNVQSFFEFLNRVDNDIKFTMELETDQATLPFLDCLVHRATNKLKTTLYRKPSNPLTVLRYNSANPQSTFKSIAFSLFKKVEDFCTEEADKVYHRRLVRKILSSNGYPKSMISGQQKRARNPTPLTKKEWVKTVVLPYKQGTSEALQRVLNKANIRLASKKGNTLRSSLVRLKDPLPVQKTRNCIYKVRCIDCPATYVGLTARELEMRIREHKRYTTQVPQNDHQYEMMVKRSAIAIHKIETGHNVDFDNTEILNKGFKRSSERMTAEAVEIMKDKNTINRIDGIELSGTWFPVLTPTQSGHAPTPRPAMSNKRPLPDQADPHYQPANKRIALT